MKTLYALTDQSGSWRLIKMFGQSNFPYIEHGVAIFTKKILFNKCVTEFDNVRAQTETIK